MVFITESEFITITENGEDWTDPDPSADKDLLSLVQTLETGDSYSISFEVSGNQDFNVFCESGGEPGPLYLGKNKIPVVLNYKANFQSEIAGHGETTPLVWDGKDLAGRWAVDGDYSFVIEAAGRNGGYAKAEAQILITSPLLLHFISISNTEIKPLVEEICQVVMSSGKPCSIDVIVVGELGKHQCFRTYGYSHRSGRAVYH